MNDYSLLRFIFGLCMFSAFPPSVCHIYADLTGIWPPLSVGKQLRGTAELPILLSVSVVADGAHVQYICTQHGLRLGPQGWPANASQHCLVSFISAASDLLYRFRTNPQIWNLKVRLASIIFYSDRVVGYCLWSRAAVNNKTYCCRWCTDTASEDDGGEGEVGW